MADRLIIGLMSGTSVDAIDAALVRISRPPTRNARYKAQVLHHTEHRWPAPLRKRLLAVMAPATTTTSELCELNFLVAREFALAVDKLLTASGFNPTKIAALGSHGQTICHLPPSRHKGRRYRPIPPGSTLQLGDPSVLATLTGIPTVGNFRPADMALGGQGAPLVPWTDDALLAHSSRSRAIQNIGGIANVTFLPPLKQREPSTWTFYTPKGFAGTKTFHVRPPIRAFDTGPGNMLLDSIITLATKGRKTYDHDGQLALKGALDQKLLSQLQANAYFRRQPPKSTGRELFGIDFARSILTQIENQKSQINNVVHTLTRLTAWSIADAYRRYLPRIPDEVILCGGGADNPTLITMLREELGGSESPPLRRIDDFGIPNKAKEAASFALLAAATLDGIPANIPTVTGAQRPTILGVIARPAP